MTDGGRLHPGARVINTWTTQARALGSSEAVAPGTRRFIVDFAGGDLAFLQNDPSQVQVVATVSAGRVAAQLCRTQWAAGGLPGRD